MRWIFTCSPYYREVYSSSSNFFLSNILNLLFKSWNLKTRNLLVWSGVDIKVKGFLFHSLSLIIWLALVNIDLDELISKVIKLITAEIYLLIPCQFKKKKTLVLRVNELVIPFSLDLNMVYKIVEGCCCLSHSKILSV